MATQLRSEQIKDIVPLSNWDGWNTADAMTYVSATSFSVTGDKTVKYSKGTKIKLTNASTVKYFYVVSSSYSSVTTVTVTGGSDYSLASGAITSPFYSYVENPQGFPAYFNYVPTHTNLNVGNGTLTARFTISGRIIFINYILVWGSTTAITGSEPTFSTPITLQSGRTFSALFDTGFATYISNFTTNSNSTILTTEITSSAYAIISGITATTPTTWTTNDRFSAEIIGRI